MKELMSQLVPATDADTIMLINGQWMVCRLDSEKRRHSQLQDPMGRMGLIGGGHSKGETFRVCGGVARRRGNRGPGIFAVGASHSCGRQIPGGSPNEEDSVQRFPQQWRAGRRL